MNSNRIEDRIEDHVAATLYIPLLMKSNESRREKGFFSDPLACDLVDRIDYDFSPFQNAVKSSVGVAIRANYFDDIARAFIDENVKKGKPLEKGGDDCPVIVSIGCGLDTRFQRLGETVTRDAQFYELDLPEVMEMREQLIPSGPNDIYLKSSMFEKEWMDMLREKHPSSPFLFIAEGVCVYFEKERIEQFVKQLATRFAGSDSRIAMDVTSSWMCKNSHLHDSIKYTQTTFKLAMDDDLEMEAWAGNLKLISARRYGEFQEFKHAGWFFYWMLKRVPFMANGSRMLYYQIL